MDRYTGMVPYHQAKHRIFRNCQRFVFNRQDALTVPLVADDLPRSSFGLDAPDLGAWGVRLEAGVPWLAKGRDLLMPVHDLQIVGDHNVANALAALALGDAVGLPLSVMLTTLRGFTGLKHRCQRVALQHEVAWYNDSKGTNVGATLAALEGLGAAVRGRLILLAGGVGKGQDFTPLSSALQQFGKALIVFGEDGALIDRSVQAELTRVQAKSLEEAVRAALSLAEPGDAVLLSPACASFDMFKHYEDRGDQFVACVQRVLAEVAS